MKKTLSFLGALAVVTSMSSLATGQNISASYRKTTIDRITTLLNDNYVFPDAAKATGIHLQQQLKNGVFDADSTRALFAGSLTRELQASNHDKHMRVRAGSNANVLPTRPTGKSDGGFRGAKILEGNIGYIDLRLFFPVSVGAPLADSVMKMLAGTDAIIVDLRYNGGGEPEMVQYLCSYFFDQKIHLNSIYNRLQNATEEYWTILVNGKKMPKVPLYVLTSRRTFSGGEEFAYDMQTRQRATLIGETTGGGANPGEMYRIDEELSIFIPTGTAINPVTKTNWEGTGVRPTIETTADQALEKAIELAGKAAASYRLSK